MGFDSKHKPDVSNNCLITSIFQIIDTPLHLPFTADFNGHYFSIVILLPVLTSTTLNAFTGGCTELEPDLGDVCGALVTFTLKKMEQFG